MKLSQEEREARARRAREQHAAGKFGQKARESKAIEKAAVVKAARSDGSASNVAQDFLIRNRAEWEKAMLGGLRKGSSTSRAKVAESIARLALAGERTAGAAVKNELEHRSREELLELLATKLNSGPAGALVRARMAEHDVIEGTASPVEL